MAILYTRNAKWGEHSSLDSLKIIGHSYNNNNLSSSTWRHACNSLQIAEIVEKFQVEQSKLNKARARSFDRAIYKHFTMRRARIQSLGPSAAASGGPGPRWAPPASWGPSTNSAEIAEWVKQRLGRKSISQRQRGPRQVRSGGGAQSHRLVTQSPHAMKLHTRERRISFTERLILAPWNASSKLKGTALWKMAQKILIFI